MRGGNYCLWNWKELVASDPDLVYCYAGFRPLLLAIWAELALGLDTDNAIRGP
jgi:hypothetical protein